MQLPYPHELKNAVVGLLNGAHSESDLFKLAHVSLENEFGVQPQTTNFPAPLHYEYETEKWSSIYSNGEYKEFIPWFRQFKSRPTYPVLNDNLFFSLNKNVRIFKFCFKTSRKIMSCESQLVIHD